MEKLAPNKAQSTLNKMDEDNGVACVKCQCSSTYLDM